MNQVRKQLIGHYELVKSYIETVREDASPSATPEDGKNTNTLIECIELSLDEQRPVALNL